jgi:diguanylate cyclase (GGDEF)-like protein
MMKKKKHTFEKLKLIITDMSTRQDSVKYNISMAVIASFLVAISTMTIFLVELISNERLNLPYLIMSLVMLPFLFFYMYVYNSSKKISAVQIKITNLFPYVLITFGAIINYMNYENTSMIPPFLLVILSISFIHLLTYKRLILVYSYAFVLLFLQEFIVYGFQSEFVTHFSIGAIIISYACFFSYIQFKSHIHNHQVSDKLAELNENQNQYIQRLTKVHDELQQNNRITEAMMNIATEIIKLNQFDEVLQLIMNEAIKLIPKAQSGSILIYNGVDMEFRAASGYDLKVLSKVHLELDHLFQSTLDDMFEPAIITDLEVFDQAKLNKDQFVQMKDSDALFAKSILTCCFEYEGKLFGCINLDNFESKTIFNESDKKLIKHLTKQIEIAVTIHNLYNEALKPARYDALTQVYSRKYMDYVLNKNFSDAIKNSENISICAIDLNDLKYVNDLLGHNAGDQYLKYFVDVVRLFLPNTAILARVGGDEFIFGFPSQESNDVKIYIQKIRNYLSENPFTNAGVKRIVTFASGISAYPNDSNNLDELLKIADLRMYQDKAQCKIPVEETQLV